MLSLSALMLISLNGCYLSPNQEIRTPKTCLTVVAFNKQHHGQNNPELILLFFVVVFFLLSTALAPGLPALTNEYSIPMYIYYDQFTV